MCQPDLNVWTYDWVDGRYDPKSHDIVEHTCIDWDNFEEWSDATSFSIRDERGLIRKENGEVWDADRLHSDETRK